MAPDTGSGPSPAPRRTLGQRAKQGGLFILFATLLLIPRLRRLRRRVWLWSCIRLGAAAAATGLVWRYRYYGAGPAALVGGLLLFAFALLIRARPEAKSDDALADELGALIVLNGGTFRQTPSSPCIPHARIFVQADQFTVVAADERRLVEIPLAQVRSLAVHAAQHETHKGAEPWEVEINWVDDAPATATFCYEGYFAEHLARVAESTMRRHWQKELPILPH